MTPTDHIVICRSGCLIDDMRFCPEVPADWAEQYRSRARDNPEAHESYVRKIITERLKNVTN